MRHMGWQCKGTHFIGLDGKSLCGEVTAECDEAVADTPSEESCCEGCEELLSAYLTANRYQVAEEQEDGSLRPLEAFSSLKEAEIRLCHLCYGEGDADVYLIDVFESMEGLLA